MVKKICLDSDVLIELLKNNPKIISLINNLEAEYYTTSINAFEIWMGKKDKETIFSLISTLKQIPFTTEMGMLAADIKNKLKDKGETLDMRDIFIGSICIKEDIYFLTNNKKHFNRLKKFGLKLV